MDDVVKNQPAIAEVKAETGGRRRDVLKGASELILVLWSRPDLAIWGGFLSVFRVRALRFAGFSRELAPNSMKNKIFFQNCAALVRACRAD